MEETAAKTESGNGNNGGVAVSYVHEVKEKKSGITQKYASRPSPVKGKDLNDVVTEHLFGVPDCVKPGEILCDTKVTVEVVPGGRVATRLIKAVKQGNGHSTTLELQAPGEDPKIITLAPGGDGEGRKQTLILRHPDVGKEKIGINPNTMLSW